jgi:Holliday junction resolvase RusA-like endonuclease
MTPTPKGRPRVLRTGRPYTPKKTQQAEALLRGSAQAAELKCYPAGVPLWVSMQFDIPMPKSWSKKKRAEMLNKPHTQKPDLDNLLKLVEDALNGVVWEDDAQIASYGFVAKYWTCDPVGYVKLVVAERTAPRENKLAKLIEDTADLI